MNTELIDYMEARRKRRNTIAAWIVAAAIVIGAGGWVIRTASAPSDQENRTNELIDAMKDND